MRHLALLALTPLLVSAADPVAVARAEAAAALQEVERLQRLAAQAKSDAERLAAQQAAASEAIRAAEASLAAAEARSQSLAKRAEQQRARLAEGQRPAALLLAGVAQMGRRPPLLALADGASPREFVIARALLDTSLPIVHARTATLRKQSKELTRLADASAQAQAELSRRRDELQVQQRRFAQLEAQANARSASLGGQLLVAGDVALSSAALAQSASEQSARQRQARVLAGELASLSDAPARPTAPEGNVVPPELGWSMPVGGGVLTGLYEVSSGGVRSRGITIDAPRGSQVLAPAPGRIAFAGPFRRHAGIVIIDHGQGWMTLMTEVRTALRVGDRVARGDPLGRTLGAVTVELTRNGKPQDAALIAGSSAALSNGGRNS